jgi:SAM-dependent methyltransferase
VTAPRAPGDRFSAVSAGYAAFRPRYPRELFDFIATIVTRRRRAWDCGAGSGQASTEIAKLFEEVVATDVSAEQIARGPSHPRILWVVARAEASPIRGECVDLVTVAQALHWFDFDPFYAEVRRVAAPGAVIAEWTYGNPSMDGDVGDALRRFTLETMGSYWPAERRHVESEYRTIPFPFEPIQSPPFQLEDSWPLARLVGYMRTWSGVEAYRKTHAEDPVASIEAELRAIWPDADSPRRIVWPLALRTGRVTGA